MKYRKPTRDDRVEAQRIIMAQYLNDVVADKKLLRIGADAMDTTKDKHLALIDAIKAMSTNLMERNA